MSRFAPSINAVVQRMVDEYKLETPLTTRETFEQWSINLTHNEMRIHLDVWLLKLCAKLELLLWPLMRCFENFLITQEVQVHEEILAAHDMLVSNWGSMWYKRLMVNLNKIVADVHNSLRTPDSALPTCLRYGMLYHAERMSKYLMSRRILLFMVEYVVRYQQRPPGDFEQFGNENDQHHQFVYSLRFNASGYCLYDFYMKMSNGTVHYMPITFHRIIANTFKSFDVNEFRTSDAVIACRICTDVFRHKQYIVCLSCNHFYHIGCFLTVLCRNDKICVICPSSTGRETLNFETLIH